MAGGITLDQKLHHRLHYPTLTLCGTNFSALRGTTIGVYIVSGLPYGGVARLVCRHIFGRRILCDENSMGSFLVGSQLLVTPCVITGISSNGRLQLIRLPSRASSYEHLVVFETPLGGAAARYTAEPRYGAYA